MFSQLKRELAAFNEVAEKVDVLVPRDPQEFYTDFGFLTHPRLKDENGQPLVVEKLAPYQYEFWAYQGNALAIKSQKIGLTTSSLLEDFQFTLLPEGAGKDVLVIAQNEKLADDHILTLKRMIKRSKKYAPFLLITAEGFKEEKSKMSVIYVRNPYDSSRPSRIIALGKSEASVWSWKNIGKIHMSDATKLDIKEQQNFFAAVYSRLANTEGIIKIETPPDGQHGEVYNIYNKSRAKIIEEDASVPDTLAEDPADNASKFRIFEYPAVEAVRAGIISREFLEQERNELGDLLFAQLYECSFLPPGNQWYNESMIFTEDYGAEF